MNTIQKFDLSREQVQQLSRFISPAGMQSARKELMESLVFKCLKRGPATEVEIREALYMQVGADIELVGDVERALYNFRHAGILDIEHVLRGVYTLSGKGREIADEGLQFTKEEDPVLITLIRGLQSGDEKDFVKDQMVYLHDDL